MVFLSRKKKATDALSPQNPETPEDDEGDAASVERVEQAPEAEPAESVATPETIEYKFGIADRLTQAVETKWTLQSAKRSPDLVPLAKDFEDMRKRLRHLIATTKKFHESLAALDLNRQQMIKEMSTFADKSPIRDIIAKDDGKSALATYDAVSTTVERSHQKFQEEIIDYCVEWENVVSTTVDKDMKEVKKLRQDYNHYQGKVDALRKKVNAQEAKGKSANEGVAEKLERNEEKLVEASAVYEAAAGPLCTLIDEAVKHGWKDLFPLMQSLLKWDGDRSQAESKAFSKLNPDGLTLAFKAATGNSPASLPKKKTKAPKRTSKKAEAV